MNKLLRLLACALVGVASPLHAEEVLTNDSVLQLVEVGLGDEAVIAKIGNSQNSFDVSTDALIALRKAGLSSAVIAKMIDAGTAEPVKAAPALSIDSPDPNVPHPAGVYLLADWQADPKMQVINATTSNQTKTGGFFGYVMTGGLASMSFKTVIPNAQARVKAPRQRPVFYFYFAQPGMNGDAAAFWLAGTVSSPAEFSLVQFNVKKDSREAKVGSFNIGGAKSGVMDKDRIPFTYEMVSPGVFKAQPDIDLENGEYGFLYSSSTGGGPGLSGGGATTARIFDFSVDDGTTQPTKKKKRA